MSKATAGVILMLLLIGPPFYQALRFPHVALIDSVAAVERKAVFSLFDSMTNLFSFGRRS